MLSVLSETLPYICIKVDEYGIMLMTLKYLDGRIYDQKSQDVVRLHSLLSCEDVGMEARINARRWKR